jgi:hypothetical protein
VLEALAMPLFREWRDGEVYVSGQSRLSGSSGRRVCVCMLVSEASTVSHLMTVRTIP